MKFPGLTIIMLLSFLLHVLTLYSQCENEADLHFTNASNATEKGDYALAAQLFEKSAEAERRCNNPRMNDLALELYNAASCYKHSGNIEKCVQLYKENIEVNHALKLHVDMAKSTQELTEVLVQTGQLASAGESSKKLDSLLTNSNNVTAQYISMGIELYLISQKPMDNAPIDFVKRVEPLEQKNPTDSVSLISRGFFYIKLADAYVLSRINDTAIIYYKRGVEFYKQAGAKEEEAFARYTLANVYARTGSKDNALEEYEASGELFNQEGDEENLAQIFSSIGNMNLEDANHAGALFRFENAMQLYKKTQNAEGIANTHVNIGNVYKSKGGYQQAAEQYNKAIAIYIGTGNTNSCSIALNNLGGVYIQRGEFDIAIVMFEQLLSSNAVGDNKRLQSLVINNIGGVYMSWGQYDKAMQYYQKSLAINEQLQDNSNIALVLNNIGGVYQKNGKMTKALDCFNRAIDLYDASGNKSYIPGLLNNIGNIYVQQGDNERAIETFNKALALAEERGDLSKAASISDNIGGIYTRQKKHIESELYLQKALKIRRELNEKSFMSSSLNNLAVLYMDMQKVDEAISLLNESVRILEELRETARGDVKRDFLSAQIQSYQNLIVAYVKDKQPGKAFVINEMSRSKQLAERLTGRNAYQIPGTAEALTMIDSSTVVLSIATTDNPSITSFTVDNRGVTARLSARDMLTRMLLQNIQIKSFVVSQLEREEIERLQKYLEEDVNVQLDQHLSKKIFEKSVRSYTQLLNSKVYIDVVKAREIAKVYYSYFIAPVEQQLEGKSKLVIMPDGVLGLIPFETLIDHNGRYVIERFDVSYIHSFSVQMAINQRIYSQDRKPMLAMGVFNYKDSTETKPGFPYDLATLKQQVYADIDDKKPVGKHYATLGYSSMNNLESGKEEIERIAKIFEETEVVPEEEVTEETIKAMSTSGELARYKIIHFSTHGITVPEIAELSTLVLNTRKRTDTEDQYLRAPEIAHLRCQADFMNLSACETGLGKIYSGEGIVGLSQSCIVSGANSISMSLWQVDEESTTEFMTRFYTQLKANNYDYKKSMNDVKRKFIKGEAGVAWSLPYFWSPFVYYGKL